MNENGYLTVRGKPFRPNHVWSMRTKFKGRENQFIEGPTFDYEDLRIEISDLYGKIHTLRDFSEFL